jgi:PAS domain S-box-containing protein
MGRFFFRVSSGLLNESSGMIKDKKFSNFITRSLMFFMGIFFMLAAVTVYFIRDFQLERDAYEMLSAGEAGFNEALNRQFNHVGQELEAITSDYLIRDFMLHGDTMLLSDTIKARYSFDDRVIIVHDDRNDLLLPALPSDIAGLQSLLRASGSNEKQANFFQHINNKFVTILSRPIMNMGARIGTGYLIYDISKDRHFWDLVRGNRLMFNRILIHDKGEDIFNLDTGEKVILGDKDKAGMLSDKVNGPLKNIFKDEILFPLKDHKGLFYAASIKPLEAQKTSLRLILINLCVFIFVLTLLVSFFMARVLSRPLERRAEEAVEISLNPTNKFLKEDSKEYYEFRLLSHAFNQVLSNLFKAQEELKSEARKELEASEERYRLTVETAPDTIVITRVNDGKVFYINKAGERMFGYSKSEAIGKTVFDLNSYMEYSDREKIINKLKSDDEINRVEVKFKSRNGSIMDCLMSSRRIKYQGDDCVISIITDYSDLKRAEEEKKRLESALQRASKMEAIGTMAGGVAHDLNNILSGLVGYPELMLMDLPEDSRLRKPLLTIQKSGEKAAAIVQDMLTLARRGVSVTEVVNLNKIINDYMKSPEHQKMMSYNPGVQLNVNLEPNLLNIIGSDVHLSKTLMNLISNAIEAMPAGGEISVSTRNEYIDLPIKSYDDVNEGDYVVLTVSDNGTGMSPEDRERIFEPFYTKKKMGRSGTGLGMTVVWGTVKDHDGYIDVQSELDKGATFKLYFPVTRREPVKNGSELSVEEYMGRGESVLVVDDIKEQREIASGMLTRLGYSVASVSSGEEAVEYVRQNSVDIIILDMIMDPGIDGLETYKRVLSMRPGQKVIVASGFSETERVREAQRLGAGAYVKKPYLMKNIGPAVRRELDK